MRTVQVTKRLTRPWTCARRRELLRRNGNTFLHLQQDPAY